MFFATALQKNSIKFYPLIQQLKILVNFVKKHNIMKSKKIGLFVITIISVFAFIYSCSPSSSKKSTQSDSTKTEKPIIVLDTFSTFPADIVGCSCYFSRDSVDFNHEKYIYMNDLADISYLKINGNLIKFKQTEHKQIDQDHSTSEATSDLFKLTIKVTRGKSVGYEVSSQTGTITVTDKSGKSITTEFYGVCGC